MIAALPQRGLRTALVLVLAAACSCRTDRTARLSLPLPIGGADSPGVVLPGGTYRITGWALSEDPIETISVYIDGRYVTSAVLGLPRPEVARQFPLSASANSGWIVDLDSHLFPGSREVVIQVRTIHGIARDLLQTRALFPDK